ncbi:MAG: hypothetical protein OEM00_06975, partial [Burkholderiaceae bacterium]|nr:hypothetical protein [Burkholderiaceae bacterium]
TTNQVKVLTTEQIAALSTDDLNALNTTQFATLSSAQVAALTTAQIAALNTNDIVALTTTQVGALTTDQIVALTTDQVVVLETADIAAMSMTQVAAFESEDVAAMSSAQLDALFSATPIVLDLDGNGVRTVAASNGVNFDLNATGNSAKVGWASAGDGLLVMDRNGDGVINDGRELFGAATQTADDRRAGHGYAAMALEDSNNDGMLDASDARWSDLRLWVDANQDGRTDAGELKTLAEYDIMSLDLNVQAGSAVDNGNLLGLVSSYTTTNGETHEMADVWFSKASGSAEATPPQLSLSDLLAGPSADVLPSGVAGVGGGSIAPSSPVATFDARLIDQDESRSLPLI